MKAFDEVTQRDTSQTCRRAIQNEVGSENLASNAEELAPSDHVDFRTTLAPLVGSCRRKCSPGGVEGRSRWGKLEKGSIAPGGHFQPHFLCRDFQFRRLATPNPK